MCGCDCEGICCLASCISLFLFTAEIVIFTTLNYAGVDPRFYVQDVYIPALKNSGSFNASNLNTSVFVDVKFQRAVAYIPITYEDVKVTLFYDSNSSFPVGYGVVPAFVQGRGKMSVRRKAVVAAAGLPWEDAMRRISGGSTVDLAVEMATRYSVGDDCHETPVTLAAEVRLGASGHKVSKKPVRLR